MPSNPPLSTSHIVAAPGGAPSVSLSADSVAYLVELLQLARWSFQRHTGALDGGLDTAMAERRIGELGTAIEELIVGAAVMGVRLELSAVTDEIAQQLSARRAGPAH